MALTCIGSQNNFTGSAQDKVDTNLQNSSQYNEDRF
jgi:hypothetical protein